ncbi:MAG: NAD(+) synthase [Chlorobiota bacterium]
MSINLRKYNYIRVFNCSPKLRVADVDYNTDAIIELIEKANDEKADICLFPELSISSYSCNDLFFQSELLESVERGLERIRKKTENTDSIVVVGAPLRSSGRLFNCAVAINSGRILGIVAKKYIISTNEFYEERWFSSDVDRRFDTTKINGQIYPFGSDIIFQSEERPDVRIGIEICEDLWAVKPPSLDLSLAGANIILNLSASNELLSKSEYRRELVTTQSARTLSNYIYSSCGPGESTTDLIYSGHLITAENGKLLSEQRNFDFDSHYTISDLDLEKVYNARLKNSSYGFESPEREYRIIKFSIKDKIADKLYRSFERNPFIIHQESQKDELVNEILEFQSTGLAKRLLHINGKNVVLGLSGGLDSTLALIVAIKAFEKLGLDTNGIHALILPGLGTSVRTNTNANELINNLNITGKVIDISVSVRRHFIDLEHKEEDRSVVYENAQARERTQILMDYANKHHAIVVGTGDLSEIALGWSTYNADHMSMYNVNAGLPKTVIQFMISVISDWNDYSSIANILKDIVATPISPELLPQENGEIHDTQKIIGPYEVHDVILYYFIKHSYRPSKIFFILQQIFNSEYSKQELLNWLEIFFKRFFGSQFKRSCMPDGIKIGSVSLSPRGDWRMPSDTVGKVWLDEISNMRKDL